MIKEIPQQLVSFWSSCNCLSSKRQGSGWDGRMLLSLSLLESTVSHSLTQVQISSPPQQVTVSAFIDSGAGTNLVDIQFAKDLGIEFLSLPEQVRSLNNQLLHRVQPDHTVTLKKSLFM